MKIKNLMNLDFISGILFLATSILYMLRFVPWNLAFKDGFFDGPDYVIAEGELINANRQEYNVYRGIRYVYAFVVLVEFSARSLPKSNPVRWGAEKISSSWETFSF